MKGALLVILCVLGVCFSLAAQQADRTDEFDAAASLALYRPEIFSTVDSLVLIQSLPVLTLLDGQRLPVSSEMGRMGTAPLDLPSLAYVSAANARRVNAASAHRTDGKDFGTDGNDSSAEVSSRLNPVCYGGEVGVLYGRSSGKFGGDVLQTYILGEVGNEKVHITVGAAYEESSGRLPRFRSFEPLNR